MNWLIWNSRDDQGELANIILKGHQRTEVIRVYKQVFLSLTLNWKDVERWWWLHYFCVIKTHRLICNVTYFDYYVTLTWYFDLDLSKSNHTSFEASLRGKHDDAIVDSLSLLLQKYSWKNIPAILTIFGLWGLSPWPEVTFDQSLSKEELKKTIGWYHSRSSSYHSSWHNDTFSEKYKNTYRTLTFDDHWRPQYCSERKNDRILLNWPINPRPGGVCL